MLLTCAKVNGFYVSNVLAGLLMPVGIMVADTIPGLFKCTNTGRMNVEAMTTLYGPLLGVTRGDLFEYVLLLSVFVPLMISVWVNKVAFQLTALILMIWMSAYLSVVGVYMTIAMLPPCPYAFWVLGPLLVYNAVWRAQYLRRQFGVQVNDGQLLGWAISCFVFVFACLSGSMLYRSSRFVASADIMRDKMNYFALDGHGQWLVGAHEPVGFVIDQALIDAAASEQAGLFLLPWWSAVGVLWAMFATIGALTPAAKVPAAEVDLKAVKLLG